MGKGRVMSSDLPGPNELGGKTVPAGKCLKAAPLTAEPQDREVVGRWILAGEDPLLKSGRERGQKMVLIPPSSPPPLILQVFGWKEEEQSKLPDRVCPGLRGGYANSFRLCR